MESGSEETDYMPDNPSNLFDLLEDSDETYPPEADVLPTEHRQLFKSRLCPLSETKRK